MEVTDVCQDCGNPIIFTGSFWDHVGAIKPKHPATPRTVGVVPMSKRSFDELDIERYGAFRDAFNSLCPQHGYRLLRIRASEREGYPPCIEVELEQEAMRANNLKGGSS